MRAAGKTAGRQWYGKDETGILWRAICAAQHFCAATDSSPPPPYIHTPHSTVGDTCQLDTGWTPSGSASGLRCLGGYTARLPPGRTGVNPRPGHPRIIACRHRAGAAVPGRLHCSPPTWANRGQSQAGSPPDYRMQASCRGCGAWAVTLLASHLGEPGSIPGRVTPGLSHAGIVPGLRCLGGYTARLPPGRTGVNPRPGHPRIIACRHRAGAAVPGRLHCSPPTWANRGQSQAGSPPDYRMQASCRGCGAWAVTLLASHLGEPGSIPGRVTPDYRMQASCRGCGAWAVTLLASHLGEPGSIPGRVTPGLSHAGIVPGLRCLGGYTARLPPGRTGVNPRPGHPRIIACRHRAGAAVPGRLHCSPPTWANRGQSQAGSPPDYRMQASCRGCGAWAVTLLASHLGEPGSIPGRVTPGLSHAGIVPGLRCLGGYTARLPPGRTGVNPRPGHPRIIACRHRAGAAVPGRLHCSPPTWANRGQSQAGSPPDYRMQASCRGCGAWAVTLLASHLGEPGSIPGRVTPGLSHAGIVPGLRCLGGYTARLPPGRTGVNPRPGHPRIIACRHRAGAAVPGRLHCSPPTWANRGQSQAGSPPDYRMQASCRGCGAWAVTLLASHLGEPGSIPGRVTPGLSHAGIVPGNAANRRIFLGHLPFPPPLRSGATRYSPLFTLIGSRDLDATAKLQDRERRRASLHRCIAEQCEVVVASRNTILTPKWCTGKSSEDGVVYWEKLCGWRSVLGKAVQGINCNMLASVFIGTYKITALWSKITVHSVGKPHKWMGKLPYDACISSALSQQLSGAVTFFKGDFSRGHLTVNSLERQQRDENREKVSPPEEQKNRRIHGARACTQPAGLVENARSGMLFLGGSARGVLDIDSSRRPPSPNHIARAGWRRLQGKPRRKTYLWFHVYTDRDGGSFTRTSSPVVQPASRALHCSDARSRRFSSHWSLTALLVALLARRLSFSVTQSTRLPTVRYRSGMQLLPFETRRLYYVTTMTLGHCFLAPVGQDTKATQIINTLTIRITTNTEVELILTLQTPAAHARAHARGAAVARVVARLLAFHLYEPGSIPGVEGDYAAMEKGDHRENPPTNDIVGHDSHHMVGGEHANCSATVAPSE
ncbi:hypothetical protein PR048_020676 [Dryococelus australis]|uniref:Uncharacterized protein n=1 Tax=Dryococelus australis TaxID=614101 RepID=A0ABQ9H6X7_9NEOP|nr:hypothetical protein PR048_020676 [Dryococelus australis]